MSIRTNDHICHMSVVDQSTKVIDPKVFVLTGNIFLTSVLVYAVCPDIWVTEIGKHNARHKNGTIYISKRYIITLWYRNGVDDLGDDILVGDVFSFCFITQADSVSHDIFTYISDIIRKYIPSSLHKCVLPLRQEQDWYLLSEKHHSSAKV